MGFVENSPANTIDHLGLFYNPIPPIPLPVPLPTLTPRIPRTTPRTNTPSSGPFGKPTFGINTTKGTSPKKALDLSGLEGEAMESAQEILKVRSQKRIRDRRRRHKICPCSLKTKIYYSGLPFITKRARGVTGTYSFQDPSPPRGTRPSGRTLGLREAKKYYGSKLIQRAHLWADRFGGKGQLRNLVTSHRRVNLSDFKIFENNVARMASHNTNVCFLVVPHYRGYSFGSPYYEEFPVPRYVTAVAIGATSGEIHSTTIDMGIMYGHPYEDISVLLPEFAPNTRQTILLN